MREDMVRAYVESLVERLTDSDKAIPDEDGDYPVWFGKALYYIRIVGDGAPIVRVFSIAVADLDSPPELLEEINRINGEVRFCRVFWVRGQVLVEADLMGENLEPATFRDACLSVATMTDQIAPALAETFGGRLAFDEHRDREQKTLPATGVGLYL